MSFSVLNGLGSEPVSLSHLQKVSKHLQKAVVQLGVAVALLVSHGHLHPPVEVLLGLVEGADGSGGAGGHLGGLGGWFLQNKS